MMKDETANMLLAEICRIMFQNEWKEYFWYVVVSMIHFFDKN